MTPHRFTPVLARRHGAHAASSRPGAYAASSRPRAEREPDPAFVLTLAEPAKVAPAVRGAVAASARAAQPAA